jgi:hypothetical protein
MSLGIPITLCRATFCLSEKRRNNNKSRTCDLLSLAIVMLESIFGLFYVLMPLAIWELTVIHRNKIVELVKITTDAVEITPDRD